ncbi:hypothetical protein FOC1_g10001889 [Fusarium oxysporum f. sp. cubense race 1]|uniref:Uncharacterized protein n=1 Tax=Fusarium oxysporum f. sp. cubense (strain race 1) TaxID=1229664 RepID=N4UZN5_FUSC1|nr:hypothetical protein FOC1_g10001889 [Fusarium oxysporum f. sp. cubense race 1]
MRIKEQANRPGAESSAKKPQGTLQALTSEASIHLQQVIERDTQYREALSQQPRATVYDAGTNTFPATSLWLDRTQWPSIYRGFCRDVLRALTRLPDRHSLDDGYILGQGILDGAQDLISPRKDKQKISFIMKALDSVINRCEDTVRATSHNLLCWLLSSRLQSRREFSFKLVVERSSEIRYRRTQKQFLAFVLRIYRMPDNSRREMVNVKMKPDNITQLHRIWEHSIWNYFDLTKGTWPVMEGQGNAEDATEDGETDDENVEAWELDDDEDDEDEDDEDDESDHDDSGHYNGFDEHAAGTYQDTSSGISGDSAASAFGQFLELLFQLCVTLSTESYLDGQPSSTLLMYFRGILGFSSDCQRFQLARQYCSKLSAMMYIQRILFLERALPLREYTSIGIPQRPDAGQFECFNQVQAKYMVLGSQYPLAELISLRDFGRNIARTEPPSMLFRWSNDGETVSHATFQITMNNFRKLADYFITQAEALCDQLMFGLHPHVDLSKIKDDMSSSKSGYSFINCPGNGLESAYLELLVHAYTAGKDGLAKDGIWEAK